MTLPHSCGRCQARWAGSSTTHCGACHLTMTGLTAFTSHRRGGRCLPLESLGMTERTRGAYTVWGLPGDEANTERLRALRAA